jgi:hypothetical protein
MIKEWADIAQSVSIIIASLVVIYGIDEWRREFVGKRRIELAEEVLSLFYQARDIIESIRSPFGFGGEGETRKPSPNERPEHKEALDQAYVLIERYNRHIEVFSRIRALRYRFMAQFDTNASKPFDDLNRIINELILSAQQKARYATQTEQPYLSDAAAEKHNKKFLEVDSVYYCGSEDDPIAPRVEAILEDVESTCKKIIESRSTLFSIINLRLWK